MLVVIGGGQDDPEKESSVSERAQRVANQDPGWFRRAESLLESLTGVLSARVVVRPGGPVEEVHVLTSDEIHPKQTVRNVESALQAQFGLRIDHRKISVAQTTKRPPVLKAGEAVTPKLGKATRSERVPISEEKRSAREPAIAMPSLNAPSEARHPAGAAEGLEKRILFIGHSVESQRSHRVRLRVALEWLGDRYVGEALAADRPRARLDGFANATLRAVEGILTRTAEANDVDGVALGLEGVSEIDAFGRKFVIVAVNALFDRKMAILTGSGAVQDSLDRAVILATLQATDRRVRAFLEGVERFPMGGGRGTTGLSDQKNGDPFEVWG